MEETLECHCNEKIAKRSFLFLEVFGLIPLILGMKEGQSGVTATSYTLPIIPVV